MRRFLRHSVIAVLVLGVLVGAVAAWAWLVAREPERVAVAFVEAWAAGQADAALALTTPAFLAEGDAETLAWAASELGLGKGAALHWAGHSVSGDFATSMAVVEHSPELKLPLQVHLRRQDGAWAVHAVSIQRAGVTVGVSDAWPDEALLTARTAMLLRVFAHDALAGDFADSFALMSWEFRQQWDATTFGAAFAQFTGPEADFTVIERYPPEFEAISLDFSERVLNVRGRYRTLPSNLVFSIDWVREGFSVRPYALEVETVKP
ncbi:MAG TPA: hypothetical protein VFG21_05070 [Xanthomonadaceae bacterium]|nr:hypothetical protein [Xanthomonadaceae bacterium]